MRRLLIIPLLFLSLEAKAFFFPEIPFCPLGGPPGWANRIYNDDYYRYPPPGYTAGYWYRPYRGSYPYSSPAYAWRAPRRDGCESGLCPF